MINESTGHLPTFSNSLIAQTHSPPRGMLHTIFRRLIFSHLSCAPIVWSAGMLCYQYLFGGETMNRSSSSRLESRLDCRWQGTRSYMCNMIVIIPRCGVTYSVLVGTSRLTHSHTRHTSLNIYAINERHFSVAIRILILCRFDRFFSLHASAPTTNTYTPHTAKRSVCRVFIKLESMPCTSFHAWLIIIAWTDSDGIEDESMVG